jgi:hypothetical protein
LTSRLAADNIYELNKGTRISTEHSAVLNSFALFYEEIVTFKRQTVQAQALKTAK